MKYNLYYNTIMIRFSHWKCKKIFSWFIRVDLKKEKEEEDFFTILGNDVSNEMNTGT